MTMKSEKAEKAEAEAVEVEVEGELVEDERVGMWVEPGSVIRRPDVTNEAFMERMRVARRMRGLVGLVEALIAECELDE